MRPSLRTLLQRWRRLGDDAGGEVTVGVDVAKPNASILLAELAVVSPSGRVEVTTAVPMAHEIWLAGERIHPPVTERPRGVANHESPGAPTATKALGSEKNRAKWVENDVANDDDCPLQRVFDRAIAIHATLELGTSAEVMLAGLLRDLGALRHHLADVERAERSTLRWYADHENYQAPLDESLLRPLAQIYIDGGRRARVALGEEPSSEEVSP